MKLVVGLGNPGNKYESTRHNVGFEVIERLAREQHAEPPRPKFDGDLRELLVDGEKLLLLQPLTYMNRSGQSVRKAMDFYRIEPADVLVVCDEFQLPLGLLRLRPQGSAGGHNGLADVIGALGTNEVPRLRIGIGPVPDRWDPVDFVLGKFAASERDEVNLQVARAADAVLLWRREGAAAAMNRYNQSKD